MSVRERLCGVRWGDNTCELPHHHSGPHKHTFVDEAGRTRTRTWLSRWAA